LGEHDHGYLQLILGHIFMNHREDWGVRAVVDVRLRIHPSRYRIPDLTILRSSDPRERITIQPPLLVIEILSPEDRLNRYQERINDYLAMGVENIWILDPESRQVWTANSTGLHLVQNGELTVAETPIRVVLGEVFAELDRA
jgi:Uma2 family endonuclease